MQLRSRHRLRCSQHRLQFGHPGAELFALDFEWDDFVHSGPMPEVVAQLVVSRAERAAEWKAPNPRIG
jgi:hypothetical protein